VWPEQNQTQVAIMSTRSDHDAIVDYVRSFDRRPLGILSMIESWMVHGTDHWYMRPSAWERIPSLRQAAIVNDIMDASRNIGFEYPWSILDEARLEAIESAQSVPSLQEVARHEKSKLRATGIEIRKHPLPLDTNDE
jgi:hypothetical protein